MADRAAPPFMIRVIRAQILRASHPDHETRLPTTAGRAVTAVLLVAALAVAIAQTIVVAALPGFQQGLHTSAASTAWLLTGFMLAAAVATPVAGRLGDQWGYRRILVTCLVILAAGSVLAATADAAGSFPGVLAARVVQGLSAGVFPATFGIARTTVPPGRVRGVIAALSAMFGVGGAAGLVVAGPVTSALGTMWLFGLTLVLALAALAGAPVLPGAAVSGNTCFEAAAGRGARPGSFGRPARTGSEGSQIGRIDIPGAAALSGAVVSLLLAISQGAAWGWGSGAVIGLFAAAVVLAVGFVRIELRASAPLADIRLLRYRALATTNLATLVVSTAMFSFVTMIPQFVQAPVATGYGFGASAASAGLIMVPVAVLMLVTGPLAARLSRRTSARFPLQAGAGLAAAAFVLVAADHTGLGPIYLAGAVLGAGYGLAFAAIGNLVVDAVPPGQTGVATGINTILRTIGGAIGAQTAAAILASSAGATGLPAESGYAHAFAGFAVIAVCALAAATAIPVPRRPR